MSHPSDGQRHDGRKRFTARPRREPDKQLAVDRTRATLEDMQGLYDEVQEIVDEGRESFMAADNRRTRRAATAIVIHLSDAANRKEIVTIRDRFPEVNWPGLRLQRNILGHQYRDIDFDIVWQTLAEDFPRERQILGFE